MSTGVRPARSADAGAIARAHATAWRETYTGMLPQAMVDGLTIDEAHDRWAAKTAPNSGTGVFVAEADGAVVGFAAGCPAMDPDMGTGGVLDFLYIVKAGQGMGFGRALTEAVGADLYGQGFADMGVVVHADNPAREFYRVMGAMEVVERFRDHRGFDCPEVLLRWDLPLSSAS